VNALDRSLSRLLSAIAAEAGGRLVAIQPTSGGPRNNAARSEWRRSDRCGDTKRSSLAEKHSRRYQESIEACPISSSHPIKQISNQ